MQQGSADAGFEQVTLRPEIRHVGLPVAYLEGPNNFPPVLPDVFLRNNIRIDAN